MYVLVNYNLQTYCAYFGLSDIPRIQVIKVLHKRYFYLAVYLVMSVILAPLFQDALSVAMTFKPL